ncbi:MAG: ATP-dependent Clp protease proteolytic subunit [Bacteriovoracaceae bacterium]
MSTILNHNNDNEAGTNFVKKEMLLRDRSITLFNAVNAKTAQEVIESLLFLEAADANAPIKFYINSPGGEVISGFGIYDVIRFIKPDVKIICSGFCASIATILMLAAKKEHRLSLPNGRFLIHQPLISGQIYGQATDIQIHAEQISKTREKINQLLSKETGMAYEKVCQDTDRDYWMTAEEAIKYGLISKIISSRNEIP